MLAKPKSGAEQIADERARQINQEGYDEYHDEDHDCKELAEAAVCYLGHYLGRARTAPNNWPWGLEDWRPKTPIRDLVRAGALIAAEIDRIQRELPTPPTVDKGEG